jgi:erythromycin esterase-like protein
MPRSDLQTGRQAKAGGGLAQMIAEAAEPLADIDDPRFASAFDRFAEARVVLLGEAYGGVREFQRARAAITCRLIEKHGFSIIALDADAGDVHAANAYVRGDAAPAGAERAFRRFPAWAWRNREFLDFLEALRGLNAARGDAPKVGVYGLDLYDLSASMRVAVDHLDGVDPDAARAARSRYGCQTPWADDPAADEPARFTSGYAGAETAVTALLAGRLARQASATGERGVLSAAQAARLSHAAEGYYRAMYRGGPESWNRRSVHMFETLDAILAARGAEAKAIVWAHNAQVGDAAGAEMGVIREEVSLGQLCRETWGREAALIGLGASEGTLACAEAWDGPMEVRRLTAPLPGSQESLCRAAGRPRALLDLRAGRNEDVRAHLAEPRLQRFIGAVYRPEAERWSHYADGSLSRQYDAWLWFDEARAVTPLPTAPRAAPSAP